MKFNKIFGVMIAAGILATGCFSKTYDDAVMMIDNGQYEEAKKVLISLANNDENDNAMYMLYSLHQINPSVMDEAEAYGWLQRAADSGRLDAQYEFGLFLTNNGRFTEAYKYLDLAKVWKEERALKLLDKYHDIRDAQIKSEHGDTQAMFEYAKWLLSKGNQVEAEKWARQSAMEGNYDGISLFGTILYEKKDYNNAIAWFEKPKYKTPVALYYLARMYLDGDGVIRNQAKAYELMKQAALAGNLNAIFEIGKAYLNGAPGVEKDTALGLKYMEKAAAENMIEAQFILGSLYENGIGVEQDYGRAINLYRLAAEHDFDEATIKVGQLYTQHGTTDLEREEGIKWLEKAIIEKNDSNARTYLAYAYTKGLGVQKNFELANKWYKEAAQMDVAEAQFCYGVMLLRGEGTDANLEQASYWIEKAAYNKFPLAVATMSFLNDPAEKIFRNSQKHEFWKTKAKELGLDYKTEKQNIKNLLNTSK